MQQQGSARREELEEVFERGCRAKVPRACVRARELAHEAFQGGTLDAQAYTLKKRELDRAACTAGDVASCLTAASELLAARDASAALVLYVHGCNEKSGEACYEAARLLLMPEGPTHDAHKAGQYAERARPLLEDACTKSSRGDPWEPGRLHPCAALADMMDRGMGGPRDPERAKEMKRKACDGGHRESCGGG